MADSIKIIKVIIVAGPTASGKTALALEVARRFNGELINADSRQIYKHMDIGTNKGKLEPLDLTIDLADEKLQAYSLDGENIPAWLFDLKTPDQLYSVSEYYKTAVIVINDIVKRGKLPVIIGGTGLYLDALIKGYAMVPVAPNQKLRDQLSNISAAELFRKLQELDSKKADALNQSDKANPRRLIRAIELIKAGEQSIEIYGPKLDVFMLYPKFNRDELFKTINLRVVEMFDLGLIDEVKDLKNSGFAESPALQGIGYREVLDYLDAKIDMDTCIKLIQQGHRNYAKRQSTWFEGLGRNYDLHIFDFVSQRKDIFEMTENFLR